jgi:FMN-dependent NADH-azoreductase
MLDNFIDGFKSKSNYTFQKIYLNDIKIDHYSFNNRLGPTEEEKDFKDLCEKIKNAKALVIATPTYNFGVPAGLKNLIDRIRFFALDFQNKSRLGQPGGMLAHLRVYFLVSGGTPNWAQKILFFAFPPFWLRGVFLYYGSHCLGAMYSGDVQTAKNQRILGICKKRGVKFAEKLESGAENAILERIFFRPPQHLE